MKTKHAYTRKTGSQKETPSINRHSSSVLEVGGYQGYSLSDSGIHKIKPEHRLKYEIVRPYLNLYSKENSLVDIGASSGVIGLLAYFDGFKRVAFVDHDSEYIEIIKACAEFINADSFEFINLPTGKVTGSFDIGFAFALIHWIYSYSEKSGSLQEAVGILQRIAPNTLFVEWVSPEDGAIRKAKHTEQNLECIESPYNKTNFVEALMEKYSCVQKIGTVSKTREIWFATNDLKVPVKHHIIISRFNQIMIRIKRKFGRFL